MHKRVIFCHAVSVCPSGLSVCPSATFVDHVITNKHIFEIFHHRVAWRIQEGLVGVKPPHDLTDEQAYRL